MFDILKKGQFGVLFLSFRICIHWSWVLLFIIFCVLHPRIGAVLLIIVCANQFKIAGIQIRIVAQQFQIGENIADAIV